MCLYISLYHLFIYEYIAPHHTDRQSTDNRPYHNNGRPHYWPVLGVFHIDNEACHIIPAWLSYDVMQCSEQSLIQLDFIYSQRAHTTYECRMQILTDSKVFIHRKMLNIVYISRLYCVYVYHNSAFEEIRLQSMLLVSFCQRFLWSVILHETIHI